MINNKFNVLDFGAKRDASLDYIGRIQGTDDSLAFNKAIDAACAEAKLYEMRGIEERQSTTIEIPPGNYRISSPIIINRSIKLIGLGGFGLYSGAKLLADPNIKPSVIHITCEYSSQAQTRSGDCTIVENIAICSAAGSSSFDSHGIYTESRCLLRGLGVVGMGGDGIRIRGDTFRDYKTNANHWKIEHCAAYNNGLNGLNIFGGDANSGIAISCDFCGNKEYGVYEHSFLGNTHIGHHTQGNLKGGYRASGGVNRSVFVSCYQESGQKPINFKGSLALWIGGVPGGGFEDKTQHLTVGSSQFTFTSPPGNPVNTVVFAKHPMTSGSSPLVSFLTLPSTYDNIGGYLGRVLGDGRWAIGHDAPTPNSILNVSSNGKTTHPPRGSMIAPKLTTLQRDSMKPFSYEESLLIWNKDNKRFEVWTGKSWESLCNCSGSFSNA